MNQSNGDVGPMLVVSGNPPVQTPFRDFIKHLVVVHHAGAVSSPPVQARTRSNTTSRRWDRLSEERKDAYLVVDGIHVRDNAGAT
jgi:hypothetical protein